MTRVATSAALFIFAGLCEIAGGYGMWLTIRERKPIGFAIGGALLLILYGVLPTFQPTHFGRAYAAYGGVFIALSLVWGWVVDRVRPDRFDLIGGAIAIVGVVVMMYWPRR